MTNDITLWYSNMKNGQYKTLLHACTTALIWVMNKLNPWSRNLLEELTVPQLFIKLQSFYETQIFIICSQEYTTCPILSQINPLHSLPAYFSKTHFNIMLLPTPSVQNTTNKFYNMGIYTNVYPKLPGQCS